MITGTASVLIQGLDSPFLIVQGYGAEEPGPAPTPPSGGNPGMDCGTNLEGTGPSTIHVEIGMEIL